MPILSPVLNKDEIEAVITGIAENISFDYRSKNLVLIGVLKGAFVFLADLIRHLTIDVEIDFIGAASYGAGTVSSEQVRITSDITIDVAGKDVLVVEDIVDTGLTLGFIRDHLAAKAPNSVRICALLDKHERRQKNTYVDYVGHGVQEGFLVGYGLDHAERYRQLPAIYHLKSE